MSGTGHTTKSITATGDPLIDGVLSNIAWGGTSITFSFPTSAGEYGSPYGSGDYTETNTFAAVTASIQAAAGFGLEANYGMSANDGFSVEGFTGLGVTETLGSKANLRYAHSDDPWTSKAYYPTTHEVGGDVWFGNVTEAQTGNYGWATVLHETGHALGLKHGHEVDNGNPALPADHDSMEYSIMTYRSYIGQSTVGVYTNETWGYAQTYMMSDIAALQHMYGADFTTNGGTTVYSWDPLTGNTMVNGVAAITPGGNRIFATIWDGGGEDTYDLSAYSTDLALNLRPGQHSAFSAAQLANLGDGHYARGNIFNALQYQDDIRSLIENAIGGNGDDVIKGNLAGNTITGNAGDDYLVGGRGNDIISGGTGHDELRGDNGDDVLSGGTGNDILRGGRGTDTMTGGTGADTFIFRRSKDFNPANTEDTITDFEDGIDKIKLNGDGTAYTMADVAITDIGGGSYDVAVDTDHIIHVTIDSGVLDVNDFIFV